MSSGDLSQAELHWDVHISFENVRKSPLTSTLEEFNSIEKFSYSGLTPFLWRKENGRLVTAWQRCTRQPNAQIQNDAPLG